MYAAPNDATYLIVDANGGYHKAIPSDQLTETDTVFDFKTAAKKADDDFELDPANATQIICGDRVYQVTSETVSKEQLGNYLDILAEKVVFDADTKMPLAKEELNKIDWTGVSGVQTWESWFYVDVRDFRHRRKRSCGC